MNEEQQAPAPQTSVQPQQPVQEKKLVTPVPKEGGKGSKKGLVLAIIVLILILVGGGSFFFARSRGQAEPTPTPTPIESPTPTPEEPEETPTPSPSPTVSPTPKPTPTPTIASKTMTLSAAASLDGFRSSNGGGNAGLDIRAGRNVNLVTRGFVSFDITGIPAGATIEKATLRLYQAKIIGDPYGVGSSLKVDHLDYGDSLGNEDYSAGSISSSFTTLTANSTLEWKDVDVTDRLKDDIANGRSRSQYRTHFAIENQGGDVTGDFTYFESANNSEGTGNTPQLVVKYH